MSDRVGQQLGNYRLLRLIGRASWASVYLGEHLHLRTQAAIKALHTHPTTEGSEQLGGNPRPASDQYALGVVVYEWLCGDPPFTGSIPEIANQHLTAPPPPLRAKVPVISSAVEQVVLKALDKDPQQRFAHVQDF